MTTYNPTIVPTPYHQAPVAAPYGYVLPQAAPQPARSKTLAIVLSIVGVLVAGVIVLAVIGYNARMGTAFKVTDKETVRYAGTATEADARKLGDELKNLGYFANSSEKDVLLRKDESGTTISFVVNDQWNQPKIVMGFNLMAAQLSKTFGKPLKVKLIDENLKELKDVSVQ